MSCDECECENCKCDPCECRRKKDDEEKQFQREKGFASQTGQARIDKC